MTSPLWAVAFNAAFGPSNRYRTLFSMSDRQLAARGFDRAGLQRSHIIGLGGF